MEYRLKRSSFWLTTAVLAVLAVLMGSSLMQPRGLAAQRFYYETIFARQSPSPSSFQWYNDAAQLSVEESATGLSGLFADFTSLTTTLNPMAPTAAALDRGIGYGTLVTYKPTGNLAVACSSQPNAVINFYAQAFWNIMWPTSQV